MQTQKTLTVSDVIETIGLTRHHEHTILFTWWILTFCGWTASMIVYLLDAAGERGGDWTKLTSAGDRLTVDDKAWTLLVSGILAAVGNPLLGILSDVTGRVGVIECCIANGIIASVGFVFARGKLALSFFICINPFIKDGASFVAQSLLAEWLPIRWRGMFIVSLHMAWNVGRFALTCLWTVIPPSEHWVAFFATTALLPIVLGIYTRLRGGRYESPRWLAVSGDKERCIDVLKLAIKQSEGEANLPEGWDKPDCLQIEDSAGNSVQAQQKSSFDQLAEIAAPDVRRSFVVLGAAFFAIFWSSSCFFYWGIEYFKAVGLKAAVKPAMLVAPVGKIVGTLALLAGGHGNCAIDNFSRVRLVQVGFFGFAACLALLCAVRNIIALTAVVFCMMVFEELIWSAGCICIIELFPTTVRNTAMSLIMLIGTAGSIIGNPLSGWLMEIQVHLPIVVSAFWLVFGGLACCFLRNDSGQKALGDTSSYGTCNA